MASTRLTMCAPLDARGAGHYQSGMLGRLRDRVVATTTSLFSHGPRPLQRTLDFAGDPGLLGPDSVSWRVIGDVAAFVGGIRALLIQTAHPEVVAGVEQHSAYRTDPLGRLTRTSFYVTATTYGALPEVEEAVALVRAAHRPVHGSSERGRPYSASDPALAAWVHNVLTDSFLVAYQHFGPTPLSSEEADRFVREQARIGALLEASPLPESATALSEWVSTHPAKAASKAQAEVIAFLRRPPVSLGPGLGYRLLFETALPTIPAPLLEIMGLEVSASPARIGAAGLTALRWALGSSPSWQLALVRSGAPVPQGLFRQPLPVR
jgi:uncharacterized protein (DUF2236 family)